MRFSAPKEIKMRKNIYGVLILAVLFCSLFAFAGTKAEAQVQVNINIGPPPIVVSEPPGVILVPRSRVYFVPEWEFDIFFYNGYWWSPRGDVWYRAKAHKGPWRIVERRYVPAPVYRIPKDYRIVYEKEKHIPYGQWKKQFKHKDKQEHKELKRDKKEYKQGRGPDN